jgi:hypothetical protein
MELNEGMEKRKIEGMGLHGFETHSEIFVRDGKIILFARTGSHFPEKFGAFGSEKPF